MTSTMTLAPTTHDKVNLGRLVRKLQENTPLPNVVDSYQEWLKVQGTLQKIKHARKLLISVEDNDALHTSQQSGRTYFDDVRSTLNRLEHATKAAGKSYKPKTVRPAPLLPTIPKPIVIADIKPASTPHAHTPGAGPEASLLLDLGSEAFSAPSASDLLLTPDEARTEPVLSPSSPDAELSTYPLASTGPTLSHPHDGPSTSAVSFSTSKPTSASLNTSKAVQSSLQDELARMATLLRKNAEHFSSTLDADRHLVEAADEKLERNFDVLQGTRVRLRDRGGKARSTTWLTLFALVSVLVAFVGMVLVIRVT